MSDLEKQGERYIVLEVAGEGRRALGTGAFMVDLSQSFGSASAAIEAAKRMTVPGGEKLIVLGFRFMATVVPPNELPDRGRRGSPMLPARNPILATQRPHRVPDLLAAAKDRRLQRALGTGVDSYATLDDILEADE